MLITAFTITSGKPYLRIAHSITFLGSLSNAFSISTKHLYNFLHLYSSCILLTINNASVVALLGIKPNCIPSTFTYFRIHLSSTLSTIFIACSNNFTPLYTLQFVISPFPLKIGTNTLACHSCGIPFPSNTRWKSCIITPIPTSPLADIISAHTSEGNLFFLGSYFYCLRG